MIEALLALTLLVTQRRPAPHISFEVYSFVRVPRYRVQYNNFSKRTQQILLEGTGDRNLFATEKGLCAIGTAEAILLCKNNRKVASIAVEGENLVLHAPQIKRTLLTLQKTPKRVGFDVFPSGWKGTSLYFYSEWSEKNRSGDLVSHENYFRWDTEAQEIHPLKDSLPFHEVTSLPNGLLLLRHTPVNSSATTLSLMDEQGKLLHQWGQGLGLVENIVTIGKDSCILATSEYPKRDCWLLNTKTFRLTSLSRLCLPLDPVAYSDDSFIYSEYKNNRTSFYKADLSRMQVHRLNISMPKNRMYSAAYLSKEREWLIVCYHESSPWPSHLCAVSLRTGKRCFLLESIVETSSPSK